MTGFTVVWCFFFLGNHQLLYIYIIYNYGKATYQLHLPNFNETGFKKERRHHPFIFANNYQPQVGMISNDRHAGWS